MKTPEKKAIFEIFEEFKSKVYHYKNYEMKTYKKMLK